MFLCQIPQLLHNHDTSPETQTNRSRSSQSRDLWITGHSENFLQFWLDFVCFLQTFPPSPLFTSVSLHTHFLILFSPALSSSPPFLSVSRLPSLPFSFHLAYPLLSNLLRTKNLWPEHDISLCLCILPFSPSCVCLVHLDCKLWDQGPSSPLCWVSSSWLIVLLTGAELNSVLLNPNPVEKCFWIASELVSLRFFL
uniref:Uncharacterized protein n=1 Tax=Chelonoidis abingdonii TaxID=106734 RepID=A0A8C0IYR2_CHEAB